MNSRRLPAEFVGSLILAIAVVGSGLMVDRLAAGQAALSLLCNAFATAAGLFILIRLLGIPYGASFNSAVALLEFCQEKIRFREFAIVSVVQSIGSLIGVFVVHGMFAQPLVQISTRYRSEFSLYFSELIATLGLLALLESVAKEGHTKLASRLVPAYIFCGYWCTASTAFANPSLTLARAFTESFTGIAPGSLPGFLSAQFASVLVFLLLVRVFARKTA